MHFRCMRYVFLLLLAFTFACEKDDPEVDRLILIEDHVLSDNVIHGYKLNYESGVVESIDVYKHREYRTTVFEAQDPQPNHTLFNPAGLIGMSTSQIAEILDPDLYSRSAEVVVVSGRLERIEALDNVITFQYE